MAKFKVGIDWKVSGLVYVPVEADTEEEAMRMAESYADDTVYKAINNGDYDQEIDICDTIPG